MVKNPKVNKQITSETEIVGEIISKEFVTSQQDAILKGDKGENGDTTSLLGFFRRRKAPTPTNIDDMALRLLEEGKLRYDDHKVLNMVNERVIPFDEYQELLADRHNDRSRLIKFSIQVLISAGVTVFCMTMIAVQNGDKEKNGEGIYLPIISGILGYWLPNPDYSKILPKKSTGKVIPKPKN